MPMYPELLLGEVARYTVASASGILPSGQPIFMTASNAALARSSAFGFASPMSSLAEMINLRAMKAGSSPPSIMRASQYRAASGSLPRMLFIKADIMS